MTITGFVIFWMFNLYLVTTAAIIFRKYDSSVSSSPYRGAFISCIIYTSMSSYCVKDRMTSLEIIFRTYVAQFNWRSQECLFYIFSPKIEVLWILGIKVISYSYEFFFIIIEFRNKNIPIDSLFSFNYYFFINNTDKKRYLKKKTEIKLFWDCI